jgi:hypothetical protein
MSRTTKPSFTPANVNASPAAWPAASWWAAQPAATAAVHIVAPVAPPTNFTSTSISASFDDDEACGDDDWDDGEDLDGLLHD